VQGTTNIVDGCKMTKSKLIYVSTSFVFDGHKKPFFEEDEIIPTTYYGLTKAKGENLVKQSGLSYLILRTDQPYGWAKKWQHTNSVLRIIQTLGSGNEFREIVDWYNTPTYVPDFVNASARLIEQNESGIFHLVGSDYVSRYDWAMLIAESFGLDKKLIIPISSTTLNLQAKRDNVYLSNEKLYNKTGVRMMGIMGGVNEMLRTRSENDKS
jgi:dTDP-4-dehydrorhamnose reductase